jgi:hypothetical protein
MRRIGIALLALLVLGAAGFWLLTSPSLSRAGLEPCSGRGAGHREMASASISPAAARPATRRPSRTTRRGSAAAIPCDRPTEPFTSRTSRRTCATASGSWTPEQFLRAMRGGVSPRRAGTTTRLPYTSYQRMNRDDARDLFALSQDACRRSRGGDARARTCRSPSMSRRGLGLWEARLSDGAGRLPRRCRKAKAGIGAPT